MDLQKNPNFLLDQLVATSSLLRQEIHKIQPLNQNNTDKKPYSEDFFLNLDPHEVCLKLMEYELAPYRELFKEAKHQNLLEDMTQIYTLKVKYDFVEDYLDEKLYQMGYESQLEKYSEDV